MCCMRAGLIFRQLTADNSCHVVQHKLYLILTGVQMCFCLYLGLHVFPLNTVYSALLCSSKQISTGWRKAVRRLCRLPYKPHCDLLPLIVNDLPCEVQLHNRFVSFFNSVCRSTSQLTRICSRLCTVGSNSNVSKSMCFIRLRYHIPINVFSRGNVSQIRQIIHMNRKKDTELNLTHAALVTDIMYPTCQIPRTDVKDILHQVCCN